MADSSVTLNLATVAGGSTVATFQDSTLRQHSEVVIQTQLGGSDPLSVNTSNPLPIQGNVGSGAGDVGNPITLAGVFNTSAPTFTTGQRAGLQTDVNGNLKINIVAGAAAGGTSSNFGASFPGSGTAVGALNSAGTLMAALNLDASGNLKVNVASGSVQAIVDNTTAFTAGSSQGLPVGYVFNDSASAAVSGTFALARITSARQVRSVLDATTNGGCTRYSSIMPATVAKNVLKASAGQLYYINCVNLNGVAVYLRFWDALTGSVTLGTTASTDMFVVPGNTAGAGFNIAIPQGLQFTTGIISAVSGAIGTTDNTAITANTVVLNLGYA